MTAQQEPTQDATPASEGSATGAAAAPRRILYVDHTSTMGGGEIALLNLVRHLDRRQFTPVVLLLSQGPLADKLRDAGAEVHCFPLDRQIAGAKKDSLGLRSLLRVRDVWRTLGYVRQVAKLMRELRVELVHTNSLKADIIAGLAGRRAGIPVLWHVRDRIDADYLPAVVASAFRLLCRIIPNYVIANSGATLDTLRVGGDFRGTTIHSGIELGSRMGVVHDGMGWHDADFEAGEPAVRPASGNGAGGLRVLLVGRVARWKGQHVFLRAAAIVRRQFPNARFQICGAPLFGEQDYEREIRALSTELGLDGCVEFMGFRSDVMDVIRQSDVLVHASITGEPFGQVIIEGMAAERPVVATRGGGVPEIVVDGTTGLLVPMGDAPAMARAVCHLLGHPELARQMGRLGRQRVLEHFTIQTTVSRVHRLYHEILALEQQRVARARWQRLLPGSRGVARPAKHGRSPEAATATDSGHPWLRAAFSLAAFVAGAAAAWELKHALGLAHAPMSMPLLAAVAVCVSLEGFWGGLTALAGGLLVLAWILPPDHSLSVIGAERPRLFLYAIVGFTVLIPIALFQRADRKLRRAYAEAREAQDRLAFLATCVNALSISVDRADAMAMLAYFVTSRLADWCAIDVLDEHGTIRRALTQHAQGDSCACEAGAPTLPAPDGDSVLARVIRGGSPELCPGCPSGSEADCPLARGEPNPAAKAHGCRSRMIVPLIARGTPLGAITLVITTPDRAFDDADLVLATELAGRAALILKTIPEKRPAGA